MSTALSQLPPLVLVAAYSLFWAWEAVAAARVQAVAHHRRVRNLVLSVIVFMIGGVTGAALLWLASAVAAHHWGLSAYLHWPGWAAVAGGLLVLDATDYWRHRISHNLPLLWRLHRVHHTDAAIDVTTTLRNHPVEMLVRPLFLALAVVAFGVPPFALLVQPLLQIPVLVFQHANIRLPRALDRLLAILIVTPAMHAVHHSRTEAQTNSNYATWLSVWDSIFFSRTPSVAPEAFGLDGHDTSRFQTFPGLLATPWR